MFTNPNFWLVVVLCFVGYFIFRFGMLSRGAKNTQIEFVGGSILFTSFLLTPILIGWLALGAIILIFWIVVTPIVEMSIEALLKRLSEDEKPIVPKYKMDEATKKRLQQSLIEALQEEKELQEAEKKPGKPLSKFAQEKLKEYLVKTGQLEGNEKPDGIIQYYDDNGILKEKWLPPQQLNELLKKGNAKRLYRVLVKDPWTGWDDTIETLWELSDNQIEKFVDEEDYAYAVCSYENGEPKYTLTKKKIWDNMEEVGEILTNPNLSEEQRIKKIQEFTA